MEWSDEVVRWEIWCGGMQKVREAFCCLNKCSYDSRF